MRHRYSRWDGSQQLSESGAEHLLDELSNDLLYHGDVRQALRDMFWKGIREHNGERVQGMRDLLERLRSQRQQRLERYNLDSLMKDLKERLDQIVSKEREGVDKRLKEAREQLVGASPEDSAHLQGMMKLLEERASKSKEFLNNLPQSMAGAVKELSDYDFMDGEAREMFQELMDQLKQRMLDNLFKGMRQQIQGMTPGQMQAIKDMLRDLNQMLRQLDQGLTPDFEGFMQKHGHLFGPNPPQSLDELMDGLQRQMGLMQSLLDSMSPEMRRELDGLLDSVLDDDTKRELADLASQMESLFPTHDPSKEYPFMGDESLTLDQAMDLMGQLQSMDDLEQKIKEVSRKGNIENLDSEAVGELLGESARRDLERLQRVVKMLEEEGYLKRKGNRLELTPRGMRKLGYKALKEVFSRLKKDRMGNHEIHTKGMNGEHSGETKSFEFGDPFDVHLQRTIMNAVTRQGPELPVRLRPDDLEINLSEYKSQAATVLLLDQSRSMGLFGSFVAAKKVAMALYALTRSQFPRDRLYVVGFSDYAIEIKGDDLPELMWNAWVSGTNLHHALMLSRKLLSREKVGTRQIIVITDGEPTSHLEGTESYFSYPPSYRTIQETLKEVKRCTQEGIIINTFMLESSYYLLDFVDKMTRINRGRAFYTTPDKLGEYVLVDYLSNRRKRLG